MKTGKRVEEIRIGDSEQFSKTISEDNVRQFERAMGDPATLSRETVCNMLAAGLICTALGTLLPGEGTRYLSQTLHFRRPVFAGDTLTVKVTVTDLHGLSNWVCLETVCRNQAGTTVLDGEAIVMPPCACA